MDELVERMFRGFPLLGVTEEGTSWLPSLEVVQTDKGLVVRAELPGIETKDVDISLEGDVLTIRGEKRREIEHKEGECICRSERFFGSFCRSLRLPEEVDAGAVEAHYKDGILEVVLPRSPEAKARSRKIEIHH
ncbi:MAG: Hsp20/alpha crystallin family protein [Thermodesulfobacteriota bacterium]